MGGGLPKPAEILEAAGNGSKDDGKDNRNGAGPGSDVYYCGSVGDIVQKQYMGYDGVDDQGTGGVQPPGGATDHRDDGETRVRRRVGVPHSSGGDGSRGAPPHRGVNQEAEGDHGRNGGLSHHI